MTLKGTTICAVRKDGKIAVAGDGQVTMGESTIFKATAHKVRRIYGGKVVENAFQPGTTCPNCGETIE